MDNKVYTLTDPLTNEIRYVGLTTNDIRTRLSAHVSAAKSNRVKTNKRLGDWIRSLIEVGEKPIIEFLDETELIEDIMQLESYWIQQFKTWGYDLFNIETEGHKSYSENTRQDKSAYKYATSEVHQYNLRGRYIRTFSSLTFAADSVGKTPPAICVAAGEKRYTKKAYGFYWSYDFYEKLKIKKPVLGNTGKSHSQETKDRIGEAHKGKKWSQDAIDRRSKTNEKRIVQMDSENNVIKIWDSGKQIKAETGMKLYSNRFGKGRQHGFVWLFEEDYDSTVDMSIKKPKRMNEPVEAYDKEGNYIDTYKSCAEAARELKLNETGVSGVARGTYKQCKGFFFKYSLVVK